MDFSSLGLGELDWVFVVIILLSTLLGVSRGMVREIFALVGWVAAFFVSLYCSADLAAILPFQAHMGLMTRTFVSIVLIVIGCVFLAGLVGKILRSILASVSIVGLLVFLGGTTEFFSKQLWWKDSALVPAFEKGITWCAPYIPDSLMELRK